MWANWSTGRMRRLECRKSAAEYSAEIEFYLILTRAAEYSAEILLLFFVAKLEVDYHQVPNVPNNTVLRIITQYVLSAWTISNNKPKHHSRNRTPSRSLSRSASDWNGWGCWSGCARWETRRGPTRNTRKRQTKEAKETDARGRQEAKEEKDMTLWQCRVSTNYVSCKI